MTEKQKKEILSISKKFAKGLGIEIAGSGALVVDPLSVYLCMCGFENQLVSIPATESRPLVFCIIFGEFTLIPAGSDLKGLNENWHDWMWIKTSREN